MAPRPVTAGTWNVKSVPELIAAIDAANQAGGANTIVLPGGKTFTLTEVNNTTDGPTGLPVIADNDNLTISGNGATFARSTAAGTPAFRLFNVASGAALTLQNLTLANGLVLGDTGMDAYGGAILNAVGASLTVNSSTFAGNQVVGGDGGGKSGGGGFGGAIWNNGTAHLDQTRFSGNRATGGATAHGTGAGGWGFGGAVANEGLGTLVVTSCSFTGNQGVGGPRHKPSAFPDGHGGSGAIDNLGTADISNSEFIENQAIGGIADPGADGGLAAAGAIASGFPRAIHPVCSIRNCTFTRNRAIAADAGNPGSENGEGYGGVLFSGFARGDAIMTVTDCSFTDNQAVGGNGGWGGGGYGGVITQEQPMIPGYQTTLTIASCTFTDNKALGRGAGGDGDGGVINSSASLSISDCTFTGNKALGSAGGDANKCWSLGKCGAVSTEDDTTIVRCVFQDNRAVGAALGPDATTGIKWSFGTACRGGALGSFGGTLEIRDSSFVDNLVIGGDGGLGGPPSLAMGGGITIYNGNSATLTNCRLLRNTVVGGGSSSKRPGATGIGGGLDVGVFPNYRATTGPSTAVTLTGTTISDNQAIGGADGGQGMGGGYAVGTGLLFHPGDTSTVTLGGGSVVTNNVPDDGYQF